MMIECKPTKLDWEDYSSDLDKAYAYEKFNDLSGVEAQKMFLRDLMPRVADLESMPIKPFQYYFIAYQDFLLNKVYGRFDKPDVANCYLSVIENKLKNSPEFIFPIMERLIDSINFVAENQAFFEAEEKYYGNFKDRVSEIRAQVTK